jgi:glycosyltransferase involved in cell wall biosynthesis
MKKIAFYFQDKGFSGLDLSTPEEGNNGVGGTQYCFIMVARYLALSPQNKIIFYHYHPNILPDRIGSRRFDTWQAMIRDAERDGVDFWIYKAENNSEMMETFRNLSIQVIAWAHNYLFVDELHHLSKINSVKRVIFVGREQYDRYIDHPIIEKATYIYNMFDARFFAARSFPKEPAVTYTGSLVRTKGFHLLARVWKQVLAKVPDAQLYVIGSGRLYNRGTKLGEFGIAAKSYEDLFMPYLLEDGKLVKGIHFCGTMGKEKREIYDKTTVGVVNPSGATETFGLSAVEMEACGIPVITRAINGLFDTVIDGKTGFLVNNTRQLAARIVKLILEKDSNIRMGIEAKRFVEEMFDPMKIVAAWELMFDEVIAGKPAVYIHPKEHFTNNAKWIRIINRGLRVHGFNFPPSFVDAEVFLKNLIKR